MLSVEAVIFCHLVVIPDFFLRRADGLWFDWDYMVLSVVIGGRFRFDLYVRWGSFFTPHIKSRHKLGFQFIRNGSMFSKLVLRIGVSLLTAIDRLFLIFAFGRKRMNLIASLLLQSSQFFPFLLSALLYPLRNDLEKSVKHPQLYQVQISEALNLIPTHLNRTTSKIRRPLRGHHSVKFSLPRRLEKRQCHSVHAHPSCARHDVQTGVHLILSVGKQVDVPLVRVRLATAFQVIIKLDQVETSPFSDCPLRRGDIQIVDMVFVSQILAVGCE